MEKTKPINTEVKQEIPITSPYYDRIRSLNNELDFAPYGSPEYHYLSLQIEEMERRARRRMEIAHRVEILM